MAEITTIARPYAEAVSRLARDSHRWSEWSQALGLIAAVTADQQLRGLAGNPSVPAERVADVVIGVCGKQLDAEAANLVRMLAENKRLTIVPEIVRLFEELKAAQEGLLEARILTAFELTTAQLQALVAKLEAKFDRKVTAEQQLDATLIGGVIIQVGDEVLDASVRGRLNDMTAALKA